MLVAGSVVMAGQSGTKQLFLMDGEMGGGGACQTQPTKFTTFASEKYFVNRSSSVPASPRQLRDPGQTSKQVRKLFRVKNSYFPPVYLQSSKSSFQYCFPQILCLLKMAYLNCLPASQP